MNDKIYHILTANYNIYIANEKFTPDMRKQILFGLVGLFFGPSMWNYALSPVW